MTPFNFRARDCEECGSDYRPRSRTQRFCGSCENVARHCQGCGGEFIARRAELAKRPVIFCSSACRRKMGGLHYSRTANRWFVICRDGGKFLFSRAVMAGHLGRLPGDGEVVHHDNEDTTDDRIENLRLLTPSEHGSLHYPKGRKFGWAA